MTKNKKSSDILDTVLKKLDPYNGEPDFINDDGVKWWLHKSLTEYAFSKKT